MHELAHGTTIHGAQELTSARRRVPLTYFHPSGPVGQLMTGLPRARQGPRGNNRARHRIDRPATAAPGQRWTFYELDPEVERIARDARLFTYLRDCRGRFDVVPGDARLSLARGPGGGYGVLVADAFSSDAIPVHLLTRQALALYRSKLREGGVLAFHISNRFLELEPVLGNLARAAGLACQAQEEAALVRGRPRGKIPSHWVAMAERSEDLGAVASDGRWHSCERSPGSGVWSDDFSSPVGALKLG